MPDTIFSAVLPPLKAIDNGDGTYSIAISGILTSPIAISNFPDSEKILQDVLGSGKDLSPETPLDVGKRVITIDEDSYVSYNLTTAVIARNGDILVFCRLGDQETSADGVIGMFRSTDEGNTWSGPTIVATHATYDCRNPICGVARGSRILLIYMHYEVAVTTRRGRFLIYSDDHGGTWSAPIDCSTIGITPVIDDGQDSVGQIIYNPITQDLLYAVDGEDALFKKFALYTSLAADNGLAWTKVADILDESAESYEIYEPSLVYIGTRLFCSVRAETPGAKIGFVFSDDDGATWSAAHYLPEIPFYNAPWNCFFPMPGGALWMLRAESSFHPQLNIYASGDGLFWYRAKELVRMPHGFYMGYASSILLKNGRVLIIYPIGSSAAGRTAGLYAIPIELDDIKLTGKASMPIIRLDGIAANIPSIMSDCLPIDLELVKTLDLTCLETYPVASAVAPTLSLYSSPNGVDYDTKVIEAATTLDHGADSTRQETITPGDAAQRVRFLKAIITNADNDAGTLVDDCEDTWNESDPVAGVALSVDGVTFKVGAGSAKFTVTAPAAIGILATEIVAPGDISAKQGIILWMLSNKTTTKGQLQLLLDDHALCVSPLETLDIPALTAQVWNRVGLIFADPSLLTAIISIGIQQTVDLGVFNLWIDDVRAVRAMTDVKLTATIGR